MTCMHAMVDSFDQDKILLFKDTIGAHQEAHSHEDSCVIETNGPQLTHNSSRVGPFWLRLWSQHFEWLYHLLCEAMGVDHVALT